MNAVVSTNIGTEKQLLKELESSPSMEGLELASKVSTKKSYTVGNPESKYRIAAIDLGVKQNILHNMVERNMFVKVFPYDTSYKSWKLSNQMDILYLIPGDPYSLKVFNQLQKQLLKITSLYLAFALVIK